jgi:hypothetical protein
MTTTTAIINKREVKFTLTQHSVGEKLAENLISNGFDGSVWMGEAPAEGRKAARVGMFYRRANGGFVAAYITQQN